MQELDVRVVGPGGEQPLARLGAAEPVEDPMEKPRMSLLQRLASVGLGRKENEDEEAYHPQPAPPPRPAQMPERPRQVARLPEAHPEPPVSEFAKRTPPSLGLDLERPSLASGGGADDQLDIPAFLRRQAN